MTHVHEWEPIRVGPESVGEVCRCGHYFTLCDQVRKERAQRAWGERRRCGGYVDGGRCNLERGHSGLHGFVEIAFGGET
jgi:hypothetical protein